MSMYDDTLHGALGHNDTSRHAHNLLCGQLCSQKLNAADMCVIFSSKYRISTCSHITTMSTEASFSVWLHPKQEMCVLMHYTTHSDTSMQCKISTTSTVAGCATRCEMLPNICIFEHPQWWFSACSHMSETTIEMVFYVMLPQNKLPHVLTHYTLHLQTYTQ